MAIVLDPPTTPTELSKHLAAIEIGLRHEWVRLIDHDAVAAARIGHAGRLVRRAASLLNDSSMVF